MDIIDVLNIKCVTATFEVQFMLGSTEAELKKSVVYKKTVYMKVLIMKCRQHVYRGVRKNLIENCGAGSYDINVTTST